MGEESMIVVGDRICLGPLERELVPVYRRWINDPRVNCYLNQWGSLLRLEDEEDWYDRLGSSDRVLTVYLRDGMVPIGNGGFHGVNFQNRTAEMGLVLGEREYWGRGLGSEAVRLLLDYGFLGLGLEVVRLRAAEFNERAIRCYRSAGFRPAGRLRRHHRVGGRTYDLLLMDLLAEEFESPVLKPLLQESGIWSPDAQGGDGGEAERSRGEIQT